MYQMITFTTTHWITHTMHASNDYVYNSTLTSTHNACIKWLRLQQHIDQHTQCMYQMITFTTTHWLTHTMHASNDYVYNNTLNNTHNACIKWLRLQQHIDQHTQWMYQMITFITTHWQTYTHECIKWLRLQQHID